MALRPTDRRQFDAAVGQALADVANPARVEAPQRGLPQRRTVSRLSENGLLAPEALNLRSVLAVIDEDDGTAVLERSCALAHEHAAKLTVMLVWSPTRLIHWTALAGVPAANLIAEHEREAARTLRQIAAEVPCTTPCTLICKRGRVGTSVATEVSSALYDCVVIARGALSRRSASRLRRLEPTLRIVEADGSIPRNHGGSRA